MPKSSRDHHRKFWSCSGTAITLELLDLIFRTYTAVQSGTSCRFITTDFFKIFIFSMDWGPGFVLLSGDGLTIRGRFVVPLGFDGGPQISGTSLSGAGFSHRLRFMEYLPHLAGSLNLQRGCLGRCGHHPPFVLFSLPGASGVRGKDPTMPDFTPGPICRCGIFR